MIVNNTPVIPTASDNGDGLLSASDKSKLDTIESGANKTIVDAELTNEGTNAVEGKVIFEALENKAPKDHKHNIDILTEDPVNPENGYMWIKLK